MTDPRVPLKNPFLAVFLGLLVPGGGQLYQGRTFKGALYAVCIIGSFAYGMFLSDWTALYAGSSSKASTGRRWGYYAQAPIGAPAVYAWVQQKRYGSEANVPQFVIDEPLSAPYQGRVMLENGETVEFYELHGRIELEPGSSVVGPIVVGRFIGEQMEIGPNLKPKPETAQEVEYALSSEVGRFELDRPIYADRERSLKIPVVEKSAQGRPERIGVLRGTIPRPVGDWLAVPLEPEKLNRLHYDLGKTYDLAMVYTWIAALLNVLVLWDAFEGPAYGYGDETPEGDADGPKPEGGPKPEKDPGSSV